jgi:hypothetical protein
MRPLCASFLAVLLLVCPALAHPTLQNAMWMQFGPDRVQVAVDVSLREIAVVQRGAIGDAAFDVESLGAVAEKHGDYVLKHLALSADGRTLTGTIKKMTAPPVFTTPERTFYQYEIEYPVTGAPPSRVTATHQMLHEFPYAIGTAWDVSYVVRLKRSNSDTVGSGLLRSQQPTEFVTGWNGWRIFGEYLHHGVMHILTGYDHLLFVCALVLATLSFWEMVKVIAAFTLAHTITLTLAVFFSAFRLPSWIVEPIIAASIVFVAVENIAWPGRAHSRVRLAVAFGFGLIHGMGFAGGLLEAMAGLPAVGTWIALGGFSIGVEVGHLLVVLPVFALLALGRKKLREGFARPVVRYGSVLISVAGTYYLFVSIHEQFFTH